MIAHAFDHRVNAGIADSKAFTCHAANKNFAGCRAVKRHVADDDVFLRGKGGTFRRIHDQFAAAHAFAEIVVRIAFEFKRHALRNECAKTLAGAAVEFQMHRVFGQGRPARVSW